MSDTEHEKAVAAVDAPPGLARWTQGRTWFRDLVGETGCAVHRLHRPGEPDLYLKHGQGDRAGEVIDEMVRLRWLAGRLPAPEVRAFHADGEGAWLLTPALVGQTAYRSLAAADPAGRPAVAAALGGFLRRLHDLPVDDCPFDAGAAVRMAAAARRVAAGEVDVDDFGEAHAGWSAQALWDEVRRLRPARLDRVVTHGDFSLDNLILEGGEMVGVIDVGRLGVADPWQDLAILWDCLGEFDASLRRTMLGAYGLARPNRAKLRFHLALDEMF